MAPRRGSKINPYSVTFSGARTVSEFTSFSSRVELRRGVYQGAVWFWLRVTVVRDPNVPVGPNVKLVTPPGTVTGLPYGNARHWVINSSGTTAAICQGKPPGAVTVTFYGAAEGERDKKNALAS